jgi:hypothetical protein
MAMPSFFCDQTRIIINTKYIELKYSNRSDRINNEGENMSIEIRDMSMDDCLRISEAFQLQGWNKPEALYQQYFIDTQQRKRDVIIAESNNELAGYVTIMWTSDYPFI